MTFSTCAPTGVAGIDVLNHPVGANPGVEICAPVALVFAADCTYQLSWSETATFSREPCAKPDGVKNPASGQCASPGHDSAPGRTGANPPPDGV